MPNKITEALSAALTAADLSESVIIGGPSEIKIDLECKGANFRDAIIEDQKLLNYLHEHDAKNLPYMIKDKRELRSRLQERDFKQEQIGFSIIFSSARIVAENGKVSNEPFSQMIVFFYPLQHMREATQTGGRGKRGKRKSDRQACAVTLKELSVRLELDMPPI